MNDLDTLRPEVREAVHRMAAGEYGATQSWQTVRAELLRLAGDNAAMREELLHVPSRSEWHQVNERAEKAEDAIFQISARLGEQREPDMDDMDWHTQLIARAQFLANAEAELVELQQAFDLRVDEPVPSPDPGSLDELRVERGGGAPDSRDELSKQQKSLEERVTELESEVAKLRLHSTRFFL